VHAEVVIGIQALLHNEFRLLQASMLGSVLSNLLLVMGCCFLFGGLKNKEQKFNSTAAVANLSLLFLATMGIVIPTPIGSVGGPVHQHACSACLTRSQRLPLSHACLNAMHLQGELQPGHEDQAPCEPRVRAVPALHVRAAGGVPDDHAPAPLRARH
jgi:hypothetical protein